MTLSRLAEATAVAESFLSAWINQDVPRSVAHMAQNATYWVLLSEELVPFGGVTRGRAEIKQLMRRILSEWEYLLFRPTPLILNADDAFLAHCQIDFIFRHIATNEQISGRLRLVLEVENELITAIKVYHDRPRVEAFLRLNGIAA